MRTDHSTPTTSHLLTARIDKWLRILSGTLAGGGALVLGYLMLATSLDVIMRTSTGRGFQGVVEYSELVMAALVFLGLGQAQRTDSHIAVDVVVRRLPRSAERAVVSFGMVLSAALLISLTNYTALSAIESFEAGERHYGIASAPMWPARAAIPIGLGVMALECLIQAWSRWLTLPASGASRQTSVSG